MNGYTIQSTDKTVIEMRAVKITGNVVPTQWFRTIKMSNGKPDSIGILLLSDIVYWYRPYETRDEHSGNSTGWRKKIKSDKLQRSYDSFSEAYGFTKDQVRDALRRLERDGVIDLEFRNGMMGKAFQSNVLYIGLNVARLIEISFSDVGKESDTGGGVGKESDTLSVKNPIPIGKESDTYTETTTESTTDIKDANFSEKPVGAFSIPEGVDGFSLPFVSEIPEPEVVVTITDGGLLFLPGPSAESCECSQNKADADAFIAELEMRSPTAPRTEGLTAEEYKGRIKAAMERGAAKSDVAADGYVQLGIAPEVARGIVNYVANVHENYTLLAEAFCREFGRPPLKSDKKAWLSDFDMMVSLGIRPEDITSAYRELDSAGMTIGRPGSLLRTAEKHAKKRKAAGERAVAASEEVFHVTPHAYADIEKRRAEGMYVKPGIYIGDVMSDYYDAEGILRDPFGKEKTDER